MMLARRTPRAGRQLLIALALVVAPIALLYPCLDAGLVSDDVYFVKEKVDLAPRRLLLADWGHDVVPGTAGYRPLTLVTYAVDRAWARQNPAGFHLTNFVAHGAVSAVLGALTTTLSGSTLTGCLAGAFFVLHPIHHENVIWVSGRAYVFGSLFYLLALLWLAHDTPGSSMRRHGVGALLFVLALWSYEATITLPLAVAVLTVAQARAGSSQPVASGLSRTPVRLKADTTSVLKLVLASALPYIAVLTIYFLIRWIIVSAAASDVSTLALAPAIGNVKNLIARLLAARFDDVRRLGYHGAPWWTTVLWWASPALPRRATRARDALWSRAWRLAASPICLSSASSAIPIGLPT